MVTTADCRRLVPLAMASLALLGARAFSGERLLGTGGVTQLEGSAGGGLTPWALISGLGTDTQIGVSAFCTHVGVQDFNLQTCGASTGIDNRLELSFARERFDVGSVVPGATIDQTVVGAKLRLFGDAVADQDTLWPQVALGVQWKHNTDFDFIPKLIGAEHQNGTDVYLAATKVWLSGPLGFSWITDLTLRASEANQFGILGFGGDRGGYHLLPEASVGVFLTDNIVCGAEYRKKPNNLSAFREDDAKDIYMAFFPVKYWSVTVAYVDLGTIADKPGQTGSYVSLQASW